jgi:hypothetical protein
MKRTNIALVLCLASMPFATLASGRLALDKGDAGALTPFPERILPVLVRVDANGRIDEIAPAYRLSPAFNRVLQDSIEEMIQGPALDEQGRRIPSQFILNLVLETSPREDGDYDASFRYASTQPVPSGRWGWNHVDGRQLALFDRNRVNPQRVDPPRMPAGPQYPSPAPSDYRNKPPTGAPNTAPAHATVAARAGG